MTAFHLFATRCVSCNDLTVHGFWHQLKVVHKSTSDKCVVVEFGCGQCGRTHTKRYRLTTARRARHRLVDWIAVAWWLLDHAPRLGQRLARTFIWLERRFPI